MLIAPLAAMQVAAELPWDFHNIGSMVLLLLGRGASMVSWRDNSASTAYRTAVAIAVFALLNLAWVGANVGILGNHAYINACFSLCFLPESLQQLVTTLHQKEWHTPHWHMAVAQTLLTLIARKFLRVEPPRRSNFLVGKARRGLS